MRLGGVLVNVSRGEIVDQDALANALARDNLCAWMDGATLRNVIDWQRGY